MKEPTAEELDAIDALLMNEGVSPQEGRSAPWYTAVCTPDGLTDELRELGVRGFTVFTTTLRGRSKSQKSEWVVVQEPGTDLLRIVPELHLRATMKFGKLELDSVPFWFGDEVRVTKRTVTKVREETYKYGFPPGTEGYRKAYHEANKDVARRAARKYQKRLREAYKRQRKGKAEEIEAETSPIEDLARRLGVDLSLKEGGE